jgi:hypothetical protein
MDAKHLEDVIRDHHRVVDAQRWSDLRAFYAREAVYQRGSRPLLEGAEAIEQFYRAERGIGSGQHTIKRLAVTAAYAEVDGHFSGVLKSGESVEIEYCDRYEFTLQGQILRRTSTFPGREV